MKRNQSERRFKHIDPDVDNLQKRHSSHESLFLRRRSADQSVVKLDSLSSHSVPPAASSVDSVLHREDTDVTITAEDSGGSTASVSEIMENTFEFCKTNEVEKKRSLLTKTLSLPTQSSDPQSETITPAISTGNIGAEIDNVFMNDNKDAYKLTEQELLVLEELTKCSEATEELTQELHEDHKLGRTRSETGSVKRKTSFFRKKFRNRHTMTELETGDVNVTVSDGEINHDHFDGKNSRIEPQSAPVLMAHQEKGLMGRVISSFKSHVKSSQEIETKKDRNENDCFEENFTLTDLSSDDPNDYKCYLRKANYNSICKSKYCKQKAGK